MKVQIQFCISSIDKSRKEIVAFQVFFSNHYWDLFQFQTSFFDFTIFSNFSKPIMHITSHHIQHPHPTKIPLCVLSFNVFKIHSTFEKAFLYLFFLIWHFVHLRIIFTYQIIVERKEKKFGSIHTSISNFTSPGLSL